MAGTISRGSLFPTIAVEELVNAVRGKSSLAKLSGRQLIPFNGVTEYVFTLDNEVSIVAENAAKVNGGGAVTAKTVIPIKFEYGLRVSDEYLYGSEEIRMNYIRQFNEGFANKIARGIDIAALHGLNPRTGTASAVVNGNDFDDLVTGIASTANINTDIESAVAAVETADHEVNGVLVAPSARAALAALSYANGPAMYPQLAWGAAPETLNGTNFEVNSTVDFNSGTNLAYVGNFRDFFRLGYGKDITFEVIEYGNPDNDADAGDLRGHNQVYLRAEAYIGWAILDPAAFSRVDSSI